jgi:hypothetical protein
MGIEEGHNVGAALEQLRFPSKYDHATGIPPTVAPESIPPTYEER